jgi:hypothetical protein
MSQQRLLEGLKSAAKVATIHRLERRGKPKGNVVPSPVYEHRNWYAISPGTRRAFGCLIDSSYTTFCADYYLFAHVGKAYFC